MQDKFAVGEGENRENVVNLRIEFEWGSCMGCRSARWPVLEAYRIDSAYLGRPRRNDNL